MNHKSFLFPMKKSEKIAGWIYLPLHIFIVPILLSLGSVTLFPKLGINLSGPRADLAYYIVGASYVALFMFRYLKTSFSDLWDNLLRSAAAIILGYVVYYIANIATNYIVLIFTSDLVNPNSAYIDEQAQMNRQAMTAVGVILAPIVEEVLFRGVVFGTLRKKNRIFAYATSTALFAFYHLWQFFFVSYDPVLFVYLLQYVPAALILAWCYEQSRNIWAPIAMHMLVNFVAISFQFL